MKLRSSLFVASRYLLGRGKEGGRYLRGAALGIALSLVPIVVTLVVADGMIQGITERYLELGTGHLQFYSRTHDADVALELPNVLKMDGVQSAWVERQGLGILVGRKGKSAASVRALSPAFLATPGVKKYLTVVSGEASLPHTRSVVLGQELAEKAGAKVGDTVRLMTSIPGAEGRLIPRVTPLTVTGIVSSGYRELDALWCILPYDTGLTLLGEDGSRAFIGVKIDDPYTRADARIQEIIQNLPSGFIGYTWNELESTQYRSYASTRQLLLFIMALVVLVAAINVSSATSMLVVERRKDIAVLKSFGADPKGTSRTFIFGALLAGIVGAVIGLSVGLVVAANINGILHGLEFLINWFSAEAAHLVHAKKSAAVVKILNPEYYLETIPVVIDWVAVAVIGLGTVACSALAAWFPARRAGRLSPTEILRRY